MPGRQGRGGKWVAPASGSGIDQDTKTVIVWKADPKPCAHEKSRTTPVLTSSEKKKLMQALVQLYVLKGKFSDAFRSENSKSNTHYTYCMSAGEYNGQKDDNARRALIRELNRLADENGMAQPFLHTELNAGHELLEKKAKLFLNSLPRL